jgi:hypothetical protein
VIAEIGAGVGVGGVVGTGTAVGGIMAGKKGTEAPGRRGTCIYIYMYIDINTYIHTYIHE